MISKEVLGLQYIISLNYFKLLLELPLPAIILMNLGRVLKRTIILLFKQSFFFFFSFWHWRSESSTLGSLTIEAILVDN